MTIAFSLLAAATLPVGCIKESSPNDIATSEQIGASASALEAAVSGMPAQMCQGYLVYGEQVTEVDMGYPAMMIIYTELLGDIFPLGVNSAYDWYRRWNTCERMESTQTNIYVPWRTFYMFVKSANDIIGAVDPKSAGEVQLGYLGMALAYRAFAYWNLAGLYEYVENDYTSKPEVVGLAVPIVTEATGEADARNNPRVTALAVYDQVLSDLKKAEEYLSSWSPQTILYPNLAVVYGLMARTYMSTGDYANARDYAQKAIATGAYTPLTQAQWENVDTGFNTANSAWMWKLRYSPETMGNLCNFTGWVSSEADWGYGSLVKYGINRWLYDRLPDADFRKHSWLDPKMREYYNYQSCRDEEWWTDFAVPYMSIKFRCVGGDWENYAVGGACDVPLMRIEEMYLIEAEAKGLLNLSDGIAALTSFMTTFRNPSYTCTATTTAEFEEEILFQKRIEFWGEGIAFFDAKRIKAGTYKGYTGTNAPGQSFMLNCNGIQPNWCQMIPESEVQNNTALEGLNNPDPTGTVKPWVPTLY